MAAKWIDRPPENNKGALSAPFPRGSLLRAKPVLVTVSSTDEESGQVSLTTRGLLASAPNAWGLCFHEIAGDLRADHFTYLLCEDNVVTISRIGDPVSVIVHRAGGTYVNCQRTSEGARTTRIFTHFVHIKRRGRTGQILLSYQMSGPDGPFSHSGMLSRHLEIRFQPCK